MQVLSRRVLVASEWRRRVVIGDGAAMMVAAMMMMIEQVGMMVMRMLIEMMTMHGPTTSVSCAAHGIGAEESVLIRIGANTGCWQRQLSWLVTASDRGNSSCGGHGVQVMVLRRSGHWLRVVWHARELMMRIESRVRIRVGR